MKNLRNGFRILISLAFCSLAIPAQAQQIHEFYTGVRQNGMGGAYTAITNDETAVLNNPSGLGKIRDTTFTFLDPEVSTSTNATDTFNYRNYSKVFDQQDLLTEYNKPSNYGKPLHLKAQMFPSVILSNFGFGLHVKYQTDAMINEAGTTYSLRYINDWAIALAYNIRLFGGIVKLGVGGRVIDRTEINDDFATTATNIEVDQVGAEGMGVSAVGSLILTAPVMWLPSLSAVVQDIGGTSFTLSDGLFHKVGDRRPDHVEQKLDAGFSLQPIIGKHVRASLTGEMHDLTNLSQHQDKMRLVHAGAEINFADFFFLRGGMNQGYWTAGAEFATEQFQLQAASYGEEVGTYPAKLQDRRWIGKFTLRF